MKINRTNAKAVLWILSLFLVNIPTYGQQVVIDPAVITTLVLNHKAQQSVLKDIKEKEGVIATAQTTIATQMAVIKELKQKVYNSMKNVSAIVQNSKSIIYATDIATDIGKYQKKMLELAVDDPELTLVAIKAEAKLVSRTADLFTYIYTTAIVGGDFNLLDNKQRLDIIRHVVNELRIMRGMAYGIYRRMVIAKKAGIMNTINPFNLNYPNSGATIVSSLIEEIR